MQDEMLIFLNNNLLSVIGLILSGVAIISSIVVSKRQDKISMFEKKYDIYLNVREYFSSPKGYPNAIAKYLYPRLKVLSDNTWTPEINELIDQADILFSKTLCTKLSKLKSDYHQIRRLDGQMSRFFSLLQEIPDYEDIEPAIREYLENNTPTVDEEKQFKQLCEKYILIEPDPFENNNTNPIKYNLHELYENQSNIFKSITDLQKEILKAMRVEIKPV